MKMMNTVDRCLERRTMIVLVEMCTNKSDWFCAIYQNQGLIQEINLGGGSRPNNFLSTELGPWGHSESPK